MQSSTVAPESLLDDPEEWPQFSLARAPHVWQSSVVFEGMHCVAMCGAACAGIGQAAGVGAARSMLGFQLGRLLG